MRMTILLSIGILAGALSCTPPATNSPSENLTIAPRDFAVLPCGSASADQPCAVVAAGGKRILFGAPAGVAAGLSQAELRQLDAVILFSLRAKDIEGLDEVRNESWRAGRDTPLLTIGPRGMLTVVDGLNAAFEQADALRIVEEGIPAGGYDAAILVGREASRGLVVFDTGDVQVTRLSNGYRIAYEDSAAADLEYCQQGGPDTPPGEDSIVAFRVACEGVDNALTWPLSEPHFIVRQASAQ